MPAQSGGLIHGVGNLRRQAAKFLEQEGLAPAARSCGNNSWYLVQVVMLQVTTRVVHALLRRCPRSFAQGAADS